MGNGTDENPIKSPCLLGNDNRRRISMVEQDQEKLERHVEKVTDDLWKNINLIKNRLPVWATFVIGGLSAIAGAAISVVISHHL